MLTDLPPLDESLILAASAGDLEQVKKIFNSNISGALNVNCADVSGYTAAFHAVKRNDLNMLEVLVGMGASLLVTDNIGTTMLDIAKRGSFTDIESYINSKVDGEASPAP